MHVQGRHLVVSIVQEPLRASASATTSAPTHGPCARLHQTLEARRSRSLQHVSTPTWLFVEQQPSTGHEDVAAKLRTAITIDQLLLRLTYLKRSNVPVPFAICLP